jgi:hypothetical protein
VSERNKLATYPAGPSLSEVLIATLSGDATRHAGPTCSRPDQVHTSWPESPEELVAEMRDIQDWAASTRVITELTR